MRIIPLTPYFASQLMILPKRSDYVFTSETSKSGRLMEPAIAHREALMRAAIPHLTIHGLRRSFGTLSEWVEAPDGIVLQIQGHKPQGTAEKHYRQRPLDLLRLWHTKIEAWMLAQGEVNFQEAKPMFEKVGKKKAA